MPSGNSSTKRSTTFPRTMRYISFSLWILDFVDTFQCLSTSLNKLSTNLAKEGLHKFPHIQAHVASTHPGKNQTKLQLLSRKGVYPYPYMNSFKRFQEKTLPLQGLSTMIQTAKLYLIRTICMRNGFGMICTWKPTCIFSLMCLKMFVVSAYVRMLLIFKGPRD